MVLQFTIKFYVLEDADKSSRPTAATFERNQKQTGVTWRKMGFIAELLLVCNLLTDF